MFHAGPIEKGANDGQTTYANDLVKALRAGLGTRPRASTSGSRIKKGRRRKTDADDIKTTTDSKANESASKPLDWGVLEPVHGILGPVVEILQPLLTSQSIIGFLLFLLVLSWFRNSRLRGPTSAVGPYPTGLTPQRMAAYEEMWRTEESALWDWLEERVGMSEAGGIAHPVKMQLGNGDASRRAKAEKQNILKGKVVKEKLRDIKGMGKQEIDWAIETTQEKLEVLKGVVEKAKNSVVQNVAGKEGELGVEKGREQDQESHDNQRSPGNEL